MSDGSASFVDRTANRIPFKILRDTGTTESLILEKVLPFCSSSATGEFVIVQGIEGGFVDIPLHRVHLMSDLVSRSIVLGVVSSLSMKGVSLLLGNDLVGGKLIADSKVFWSRSRPQILRRLRRRFLVCFPLVL